MKIVRKKTLDFIKAETVRAYRDYDISGDTEDASYYAGQVDAYNDCLQLLGEFRLSEDDLRGNNDGN